jgi:hypothetical protein
VTSRALIFRPVPVLIFSLAGALLYAVWITWRFPGGDLSNQYIYVVPIVVPFVAFLFDRAGDIRNPTALTYVVDVLVVALAMARAFGTVPFVSGHALFLTYAILRPGSLVTRITAALVMLEVIYLKLFVWHDPITPLTGIALALVAVWVVRHRDNNGSGELEAETASENRTE